ncbi:MAG TPA: hypothetical protein VJN18_35770 [Polyangiaceae bacterium]|nr:hypothetical protein [Polyangiaceae bacterium]
MGSYITSKRRVRNGKLERFCLVCEDWYPLIAMVPNARCADGVRPLCIRCNRLHRKEYMRSIRKPLTPEQIARRNELRRARYAQLRALGFAGRDIKKVHYGPRQERRSA